MNSTALQGSMLLLLATAASSCAAFGAKATPLELTRQADMAYAQGDYDMAEKYYSELVARGNISYESTFKLGNIYSRSRRLEKAAQMYQKTLTKNPDFAPAWRNMAVVRLLQGMAMLVESQKRLPESDPLFASNQKIIEELSSVKILREDK